MKGRCFQFSFCTGLDSFRELAARNAAW